MSIFESIKGEIKEHILSCIIAGCIVAGIFIAWRMNTWGWLFEKVSLGIIIFAGFILTWRTLLLISSLKKGKEDKCEKSEIEIADDLCDKVFTLEFNDKKKLYERLCLESNGGDEEKKVEEKKEIDRRSQEYWMYIWKIVYNIQEYYPEKGYLEYADNNLSKQYQSFWDSFSDNNWVTFISLVLGALGVVGAGNVDMPLIVLLEIVAIVALENLKSYLQKDEPERAENRQYREIIEGVLNASKK